MTATNAPPTTAPTPGTTTAPQHPTSPNGKRKNLMQFGRYKLGMQISPTWFLLGVAYWAPVGRSFPSEVTIHLGPVCVYVERGKT